MPETEKLYSHVISESELIGSQTEFATSKGFKKSDEVPPIDQAGYWTRESRVGDNFLRAETAAIEAGLGRKEQLEFMIKALDARMNEVRPAARGHFKEFCYLDDLRAELHHQITFLNNG